MKNLKIYNKSIMGILIVVSLLLIGAYQFININMKYFQYAMSIRTPKVVTIILVAFCIGSASIIFQSVINNNIVTPCLLGMNSLYSLIHTAIAFILGTSHIFVVNKNISFVVDLIAMGFVATILYGYLFKKTKYNVLYVLLAGTVLSTFLISVTNTLIRLMDPNEYTTLQDSLIAGFGNANTGILSMAIIILIGVIVFLRKEIFVLDVITLGKNQAINLGIDYDRVIKKMLIAVTVLIAIATALVGPISFLGLIIANISREIFKTYKHSYLVLGSSLAGVAVLLLSQTMIEQVLDYTTTVPVLINIIGGGYFLYLILRNRRI